MTFSADRPFLLVGAGKMGGAMLAGWMERGVDPKSVVVQDPAPAPEMLELLARHGVCHITQPEPELAPAIVLLAVKPQLMDKVLPGLKDVVRPDTLVMSVAAGTPVRAFEAAFGDVAIARAMPNTPAMVSRGITAVYPNDRVSAEQKDAVTGLLEAVGDVVWLESEEQIDFVTAVSGSGPAYVFHLAECMTRAGEALGLPGELAAHLAEATVSGAGELMRQSDDTPATLRQNVTSPNGTTAAALDVLMADDGIQPVMTAAVAAAARRAKELAG